MEAADLHQITTSLPPDTIRDHHLNLWGRERVQPVGRTLGSSRTLVVFPPGTSVRERLLLRLLHGWGILGALAGIGVMAALNGRTVLGIGSALAVYGLGYAVLLRATRRTRPSVRTLVVTTFHGEGHSRVHGDRRLLAASLDALLVSERLVRAGRMSPVDFELVWADVWASMPEPARRGLR